MDDLRFLSITSSRGRELPARSFATEADLGRFVIRNAQAITGITIIASEYRIGATGGGRIDASGVDARNCPVVVEFKMEADGGAICQGLYYLDWMVMHREVVTLLVLEKLGQTRADGLLWSRARLVCIAQEINDREEAVARQIGPKVELLRMQRLSKTVIAVQKSSAMND